MTEATDYIFLHGGMQGGWVWAQIIVALEAQAGRGLERAIVLDIPGCGAKRGRDTEALDIDDVVAELAAELDAAKVRQAVLVGHSQAGTILPRLIAARPLMFRRVIYLSCSAPLPGQSIGAMMGTSRQGENPDEIGWPLDPAIHPPMGQFELMFCNDMTEAEKSAFVSQIGHDQWPPRVAAETDWRYDSNGLVPATFIVCLADAILPPIWQERFAERFGAQRIVRINAGHQAMNTRPNDLAEILRAEAALPS
jgi:pimeloyl-ACP methyl ester carboxylesterase